MTWLCDTAVKANMIQGCKSRILSRSHKVVEPTLSSPAHTCTWISSPAAVVIQATCLEFSPLAKSKLHPVKSSCSWIPYAYSIRLPPPVRAQSKHLFSKTKPKVKEFIRKPRRFYLELEDFKKAQRWHSGVLKSTFPSLDPNATA